MNVIASELTGAARQTCMRVFHDERWSSIGVMITIPAAASMFNRLFHRPSAYSTGILLLTDSVVPSIWRGHLNETVANMRSA